MMIRMLTRRSHLRRWLALVMLASLAPFVTAYRPAASLKDHDECAPIARIARANGPVVRAAAMDGAGCMHVGLGGCPTGLGCIPVTAALAPAQGSVTLSQAWIVIDAAVVPPLIDGNPTGPPTPPPDRI